MRKNFYLPTAIAVTLLLAAGALALAGEQGNRQSQVTTNTVVAQIAGHDDAAAATAVATARTLIAAARNAENPQDAMRFLNQVFGLDLPRNAKTLGMAHYMMADLLVDLPEDAARHRRMGDDISAARRAANVAGIDTSIDVSGVRTATNEASTILRLARLATSQRESMIWLQRALDLNLPTDDPQAREVLYAVHITMAGSYTNAPSKRAHHLAQASLYVKNPAERARLQTEIAALGGAPVIAGPGSPKAALTPGFSDNCFDGTAVPTFTTLGQNYDDVLSISAAGDRDWYTVTVDTGDPTVGLNLRIETISDNPGDPLEDDTRLWLYTGCDNATGLGEDLIEFDDDSGEGFMSLINTECLPSATYYLRVNGWEEISLAENITLEIESTSECTIIPPDAFEPDDDRAEAGELVAGTPQTKTVSPEGNDDWNWFDLGESRMTKVTTTGADANTTLRLFYASANVPVAGLCNSTEDPGIGAGISRMITNGCNSDADCTDNINPDPGLPDCVTWDLFPPADRLVDPVDNFLGTSVEIAPGPSEMTLCLPTTMRPSPSDSVNADPADPFHWFVRMAPGRPDVRFDYEIQLEDLGSCNFEGPDNGDPATTTSTLDATGNAYGIFDYSAFPATGDQDFFAFDVTGTATWSIETRGSHPDGDSFLELWIGPDDMGQYTLVAMDDNGGDGKYSKILTEFGPAADAIPNPTPETSWYVNVTGITVGPNFAYRVILAFGFGFVTEDPNNEFGDCNEESSAALLGPSDIDAASDFTCDYDGYRFSLAEDRVMRITTRGTDPANDTTIQLVRCGTDEIVGCDEDSIGPGDDCASGYCSQMEGCLPGGVDYCVRVRGWSGQLFNYDLFVLDEGSCVATEPPAFGGDSGGRCPAFNDSGGCTSDYVYSECAGNVIDPPTMCEEAGAFPECDLPCPDPTTHQCINVGDSCFCDPILLVTMVSMTATQTAEGVDIAWTTATEVDTVGFQVLREDLGSREKAGRRLISGFIPAAGDQASGATYSFIDGERRGAKSINYYIRDIDAFGRVTEHGPITFVPVRTGPTGR